MELVERLAFRFVLSCLVLSFVSSACCSFLLQMLLQLPLLVSCQDRDGSDKLVETR